VRLAAFYEKAMGMRFEPRGDCFVGQARERCLVIGPGRNRTLGFAAYELEDPLQLEPLHRRIERAGCNLLSSPTDLFHDDAICVSDPDGNRLVFGRARVSVLSTGAERPARLQHKVVASRDCAGLANFYQKVLGFTVTDKVVDGDGKLRTCFLRCGAEHHCFAVFQANESRLDHHCYEAGEWSLIRDWADHMAAQDIPIVWGPGRHGPGNNLFMFVHDVDGNWVEISAELERVAPGRPVYEWPHAEKTLNLWGQGLLRS